ncbi:MAG: hypothetical protein COA78_36305, partial [Blastopirellula sp.]
MADDLRPQLGCYGDEVVQSPHIDQFARQALRFDHAYVQCAVCSPSRNSILSGLRPNTTGLRGFGVHLRDVVPDIVTLPQHFKNNGYETRAFGKIYHIYDESMLGDEDDTDSWSEPTRWPDVPVWGPEQNAIRDRLIDEARRAGKEFNHPHDWPRAETWDDSDVPDDQMQDGDTTADRDQFAAAMKNGGYRQRSFLQVRSFTHFSSEHRQSDIVHDFDNGIFYRENFAVQHPQSPALSPEGYTPTIFNVGTQLSNKVMFADGTRYFTDQDGLIADIRLFQSSFIDDSTSGPIYDGSAAYGRDFAGSSKGQNLDLSFRKQGGAGMYVSMFDGS